jgi:uncharacterized membrane protein
MNSFVAQLLVAGGIMGLFDYIWLRLMVPSFYKGQIGQLLLEKPNLGAAALFYIIYVVGIVAFVLSPALEKGSFAYAAGYGALFGFVAYATYDLTNLATIKGFTAKLVIVDLMWGTLLTAAVASIAYLILHR